MASALPISPTPIRPELADGIRPATGPTPGAPRDLTGIAMRPGDPGWTSKIQPPAPWNPEPEVPPFGSFTASSPASTTNTSAPARATTRVAVYNGRGDKFVLCIEAAPDWETVPDGSWRLAASEIVRIVPILRALDIPISDKTGGELYAAAEDETPRD